MTAPIQHPGENQSNARARRSPKASRALADLYPDASGPGASAGIYHWTPEGRRLYDFTSGVLVSNLGHNPPEWMARFFKHMGWSHDGAKFDLKRALTLHRLQRRHPRRGRGYPQAGALVQQCARRQAAGASAVGRVRLRSDSEGAVGLPWPATGPAT